MVTGNRPLVDPAEVDWSVIVLCGGRGSRIGVDKAQLVVGGQRLIDRLATGLPADVSVVLVGPDPGVTSRPVTLTREDPPFSGPVAGLAAAMPFARSDLIAVVAVDMPFATYALTGLVDLLRESSADQVDCVVPVDDEGRRQPLCATYRTIALRHALSAMPAIPGSSMRELLGHLDVMECRIDPDWLVDIDYPEDHQRLIDVDIR